jgi:hypothetical protein
MYQNLKSAILNLIPGSGVADNIYLGMIVFVIAGFFANKRWGAFIATVIFTAIYKGIDLVFYNVALSGLLEQAMHMILLPLVVTLLYSRKN